MFFKRTNSILYHKDIKFCSLQEGVDKDAEEGGPEHDLSLKSYLSDAYLHPIFHSFEEVGLVEDPEVKVDIKPTHHIITPPASQPSSQSTPTAEAEMSTIQKYEFEAPGNAYHYEPEPPPGNAYHYQVESPGNAYNYEPEPHSDGPNGYHYEVEATGNTYSYAESPGNAYSYAVESPGHAYHYDVERHSSLYSYADDSLHNYRY